MTNQPIETTCCIVGGGPAGMMLGYLLARDGVPVIVLEKHKDFLRDFRGDTVHPSTLEIMHELGLLDKFLKLPHQKLTSTGGVFGDFSFTLADFSRVPTRCKFVALMPQWDFLNFLAEQGAKYSAFDLRMEHEAVDVIRKDGRIVGIEVNTPETKTRIKADLIVAGDGRHSTIRMAADMQVQEFGVPIDVLWFRLPRSSDDPEQLLGNFNYGKALILIPRGDYFQAGLIIRKGSFDELQSGGIEAFQNRILEVAPYLGDRVRELDDWDQIKLLSVKINRLRQWHRPGLLCIGDAAHAMSPAGGVGINLAIQDAVAAANLLSRALRNRFVSETQLARVQKRREFPTRAIQFIQINAHNTMERVFQNTSAFKAPWQLKAVVNIPGLRHLAGRTLGVGVRPEHVGNAARPCVWRKVAVAGAVLVAGTFVAVAMRRRWPLSR